LPFGLLEHFEIKDFQELGHVATKTDSFYIFLDEKNELPSSYDKSLYQSKGFYSEKTVQNFPVRGKPLFQSEVSEDIINTKAVVFSNGIKNHIVNPIFCIPKT
jgi:hypothetical protein